MFRSLKLYALCRLGYIEPIGGDLFLSPNAARSFIAMRKDAANHGVILRLNGMRSAFRFEEDQLALLKERPEFAAPIGKSNHMLPMANAIDLDVNMPTKSIQFPTAGDWMFNFASGYHWRQPYQAKEPWHWEYK